MNFLKFAVAFVAIIAVNAEKKYSKYENDYDNSAARYDFAWGVSDGSTANDYGHKETRDGDKVTGSYSVLLPDGRRQVVTYYVTAESGYVAQVSYEGEAKYDDSYKKSDYSYKAPAYKTATTPAPYVEKYRTTSNPSYEKYPTTYKPNYEKYPTTYKPNYEKYPTTYKPSYERYPTTYKPNYEDQYPTTYGYEEKYPATYKPTYKSAYRSSYPEYSPSADYSASYKPTYNSAQYPGEYPSAGYLPSYKPNYAPSSYNPAYPKQNPTYGQAYSGQYPAGYGPRYPSTEYKPRYGQYPRPTEAATTTTLPEESVEVTTPLPNEN